MSGLVYSALPLIDQTPPKDNDVVAGWTAFAVFLLLVAAVVVLSWSMLRQFKKVEANRKAGVYGEDAAREGSESEESTGADAEPADADSSSTTD